MVGPPQPRLSRPDRVSNDTKDKGHAEGGKLESCTTSIEKDHTGREIILEVEDGHYEKDKDGTVIFRPTKVRRELYEFRFGSYCLPLLSEPMSDEEWFGAPTWKCRLITYGSLLAMIMLIFFLARLGWRSLQ